MEWPSDADGDVMRRLLDDGFDFSREVEIDFNIDFDRWPPDQAIVGLLQEKLRSARVFLKEDYILVQVRALVTYPFVTGMQADLTRISSPFGGKCESWGILT
jgi:regulator of ribonuclease activity B